MKKWYGWFIEQSLDDQSVFKLYPTVKMKSEEEDWKEHIVEIPEVKLKEVVSWLKEHLKQSWYAHLVSNNDMIVVFPKKSFVLTNKSSFDEVTKFGRTQNIPDEQLPEISLFDLARKSGF